MLFGVGGGGYRLGLGVAAAFDGAELTEHDGLQLFVGQAVALGEARCAGDDGLRRGFGGGEVEGVVQMLVVVHLLPGDDDPCAVGAEDRVGGVFKICLGVVAHGGHDLLLIVAGLVTVGGAEQPSLAAGVGNDISRVLVEGGDGPPSLQGGVLLAGGGHLKGGMEVLQVGHGTADVGGGDLQRERIKGLQEGTACLHKAVADGTEGGLAEVAAFGVLEVGAACHQGDFGIGEQSSRKGAAVILFVEMGKDEALPVEIQRVFGDVGIEDQPCARRLGL